CLRVTTWMVGAGRSTRQRVEAHYASARPAVSDDRASASRATQRVARAVEDVHEGDRVEIAPEADDPSGRRPRVGADEARPVEEPDVLVVTVTAAAVAVERVEAEGPVGLPHVLRPHAAVVAVASDETFGCSKVAARDRRRSDRHRGCSDDSQAE